MQENKMLFQLDRLAESHSHSIKPDFNTLLVNEHQGFTKGIANKI